MSLKTLIRKFVPEPLILLYHLKMAVIANFLYRFPSRKLKVIGVTGTNGKTTTCNLIWEILNEAGYKTGLTTSINFKIGEKAWVNKTKQGMQGRFQLQKLLRQMVKAGCAYAVIETTSEGMKQFRHWGIRYDAAVFTNLTPEHIESHGSFENYRQAKGRLFAALKGKGISIINGDDEYAAFFAEFDAAKKWVYGFKSEIRDSKFKTNLDFKKLKITDQAMVARYLLLPQGAEFTVRISNAEETFKTKLIGEFNISNALAAIAVGLSQGVAIKTIQKALEKACPIPGRMEVIYDKKRDIAFIVDYAHDPSALEKVYQTLHQIRIRKNGTNIIAVLGAVGGGRDSAKRPKLGALASAHAKYVIITNEDPYDDDPQEIMDQVEQGVKKDARRKVNKNYWSIPDRLEAIKKAIELATAGDVIALTGKGCEEVMAVKGGFVPWDDRKVARELLEKESF